MHAPVQALWHSPVSPSTPQMIWHIRVGIVVLQITARDIASACYNRRGWRGECGGISKPLSAVLSVHGEHYIGFDQTAQSTLELSAKELLAVQIAGVAFGTVTFSSRALTKEQALTGCRILKLALGRFFVDDLEEYGDDLDIRLELCQQQQHEQQDHTVSLLSARQPQRTLVMSFSVNRGQLPLPVDPEKLQQEMSSCTDTPWTVQSASKSACTTVHQVLQSQPKQLFELSQEAATGLGLTSDQQVEFHLQGVFLCNLLYVQSSSSFVSAQNLKRALKQQLIPQFSLAHVADASNLYLCLHSSSSQASSTGAAALQLSICLGPSCDSPQRLLRTHVLLASLSPSPSWQLDGEPQQISMPFLEVSRLAQGRFNLTKLAAEHLCLLHGDEYTVHVKGNLADDYGSTALPGGQGFQLAACEARGGLDLLHYLAHIEVPDSATCQQGSAVQPMLACVKQLQCGGSCRMSLSTDVPGGASGRHVLSIGLLDSAGQQLLTSTVLALAIKLSSPGWQILPDGVWAVEQLLPAALDGEARWFTPSEEMLRHLGFSKNGGVALAFMGTAISTGIKPVVRFSAHKGGCIDGVTSLKQAMKDLLPNHLKGEGRFQFLRFTTGPAPSVGQPACIDVCITDAAGIQVQGVLSAQQLTAHIQSLASVDGWQQHADASLSRPLAAFVKLSKGGWTFTPGNTLPGLHAYAREYSEHGHPSLVELHVRGERVRHKLAFLTATAPRRPGNEVAIKSASVVHAAICKLAGQLGHSAGDGMRIVFRTVQQPGQLLGLDITFAFSAAPVPGCTAEALQQCIPSGQKGKPDKAVQKATLRKLLQQDVGDQQTGNVAHQRAKMTVADG